jgi:hypothetical protein
MEAGFSRYSPTRRSMPSRETVKDILSLSHGARAFVNTQDITSKALAHNANTYEPAAPGGPVGGLGEARMGVKCPMEAGFRR